MKKLIQSDKWKRKKVKNNEYKKFLLKSIIQNSSVKKEIRWSALIDLQKQPKSSSKVRISNRCIFTGRKYSVSKKLKMNRLEIFRQLKKGLLPGYINLNK